MRSHKEVFSRLLEREKEYLLMRESRHKRNRRICAFVLSGSVAILVVIALIMAVRSAETVPRNHDNAVTGELVQRPTVLSPTPAVTPEAYVCSWKAETQEAYAEIDRDQKRVYAVTNNTEENRTATVIVTYYSLNAEFNQITSHTVEKTCTGTSAEIPIAVSENEVINRICTEHIIYENGSPVYTERFFIIAEESVLLEGGE